MTRRTTEAQLRELAAQGKTWVEVAEITGIPAVSIRIAARVLGISRIFKGPPGPRRNGTPKKDFVTAEVQRYRALRAAGATYKEIAEMTGEPMMTIYHRLRRRNAKDGVTA
jgi:hypothetical protein